MNYLGWVSIEIKVVSWAGHVIKIKFQACISIRRSIDELCKNLLDSQL